MIKGYRTYEIWEMGCFGLGQNGPIVEIAEISKKENISDDEKKLIDHILWMDGSRKFWEKQAHARSNLIYDIKMAFKKTLLFWKKEER